MKTPEGYEKDDLKAYLGSIGAWFHSTRSGGYGSSGAPDILACVDGIFWGIEVKREGKGPTVLQTRRMEEIKAAGGWAVAGTAAVVIAAIENWMAQGAGCAYPGEQPAGQANHSDPPA